MHVKTWIVCATGRQSIFFMSSAKVSPIPNVHQNCCHATLIGIHLHFWPGRIVREPCILRLDAYETGIASGHTFPGAFPRVIASPSSDHIVCPVPAKAKLSESSREVGAPLDECVQRSHIAFFPGRCGA